jgi:hypothetical protein
VINRRRREMYSESIKDLKAGLNKRGNNGTINISLITAQDALTILTAFHNKDIVRG